MDYKNIVDNIEEYGLKLENKTGFIEIKEIKKEFNEKLNSNSNINKQKLNYCIEGFKHIYYDIFNHILNYEKIKESQPKQFDIDFQV